MYNHDFCPLPPFEVYKNSVFINGHEVDLKRKYNKTNRMISPFPRLLTYV